MGDILGVGSGGGFIRGMVWYLQQRSGGRCKKTVILLRAVNKACQSPCSTLKPLGKLCFAAETLIQRMQWVLVEDVHQSSELNWQLPLGGAEAGVGLVCSGVYTVATGTGMELGMEAWEETALAGPAHINAEEMESMCAGWWCFFT